MEYNMNRLGNACRIIGLQLTRDDAVTGPPRSPIYLTAFFIGGVELGRSSGGSRAQAVENAAGLAFVALSLKYPSYGI
ncbi:hypothetical protein BDQ17DRAFT_1376336 [Cyathus striatus]|nr:hypothetical protein BDQ17DRAFT_1376336 [Cyathus striatus]